MIFSMLKKEKLQDEINVLEKNKTSLSEEISNMENKKNFLEKQISDISQQINRLAIEIKNRENFFIEHELMVIDTLSGLEFEEYFAKILINLGYDAQVTKASGDDGGDIIATKDNIKYVFQCKNYSNVVGNKAVQEVHTAKDIYKCDKSVVITNNYFTKQAKKEAEILSIELWDRDKLLQMLCENFEFNINNIDKRIYKNNKNIISNDNDNGNNEVIDPLLMEAIDYVLETNQASTSLIQRKLKVGYAMAGKIIDQMQERGIISSYQGSKPREVLIAKEKWQELKKFKKLLDIGAITQEEFDIKKNELLNL